MKNHQILTKFLGKNWRKLLFKLSWKLVSSKTFPVLSNLSLLGKYLIYIYFCDVPPKQFNHDEIFWKKENNFCIFGIIFFRSLKSILITGLLGLIFLFIVIPSIFRWSTVVQRQMVFLPWGKHISLLDNAPN